MRKVKRWIATCAVIENPQSLAPSRRTSEATVPVECRWNDRTNPTLHPTADAAVRESRQHVNNAHEVIGAKQVTVERKYRLESEEIVNP